MDPADKGSRSPDARFNWDDLRVFLAAARSGSAAAAGRRLGLDASTVLRRIDMLETSLRATLVSRSAKGLKLTAAGARLMTAGAGVEGAVAQVAEIGEGDSARGLVRISTAEGFGSRVLAPALPALRARHPALTVELIASPGFMSPLQREVDVAVTLTRPESPRLVTERLTDYELGLFAAQDFVDRVGRPGGVEALGDLPLVGYVEDQIYAPELRYLEEIRPDLRPAFASSSINAQREIIAAGGGVGVLPCFMAGGLVRILPEQVRIVRSFVTAALRETAHGARVRAVLDWLRALARSERRLLLPGEP